VCKIICQTFVKFVTHESGVKHELLYNKPFLGEVRLRFRFDWLFKMKIQPILKCRYLINYIIAFNATLHLIKCTNHLNQLHLNLNNLHFTQVSNVKISATMIGANTISTRVSSNGKLKLTGQNLGRVFNPICGCACLLRNTFRATKTA